MKIKKAFLVILVIILAFCPVIASCQDGKNDDNSSKRVEKKTDDYGRPYIEDDVPDDLDFGGETVTILVREGKFYEQEFGVEETNGAILNDALYNRNSTVEEDLNIKINTVVQKTSSGTYPPFDFNDKVRNSILSGSKDFDILASYGYYGVALSYEGLFRNLVGIPYLDFSKPWWNQSFINEMNIKNQLYFVIGDACFTSIDFTFATFYNKDLAKKWYPDIDFYKVVDSGDWTLDYFHQLVKDTYEDTDGSGDKSNNDFYAIGMATASTPLDPLFAAADIPITTKNSEGIPEFTFKTERTIAFFDKMYELLFNNNGVLPGQYTGDSIIQMQEKFKNQKTIFNIDRLADAIQILTQVEFDYGMLPIPKLDKEQNDYYTCASDAYSMLSIPITEDEDRLPMIGATLELLAAESYRSVTPAYFEVIMKYRYLTTDEDARMYDKVLEGVRYNFGVIYSYSLNDIQHIVRDILNARSKDFVSTYEKTIDTAEYNLEELLKFYDEHEK